MARSDSDLFESTKFVLRCIRALLYSETLSVPNVHARTRNYSSRSTSKTLEHYCLEVYSICQLEWDEIASNLTEHHWFRNVRGSLEQQISLLNRVLLFTTWTCITGYSDVLAFFLTIQALLRAIWISSDNHKHSYSSHPRHGVYHDHCKLSLTADSLFLLAQMRRRRMHFTTVIHIRVFRIWNCNSGNRKKKRRQPWMYPPVSKSILELCSRLSRQLFPSQEETLGWKRYWNFFAKVFWSGTSLYAATSAHTNSLSISNCRCLQLKEIKAHPGISRTDKNFWICAPLLSLAGIRYQGSMQ